MEKYSVEWKNQQTKKFGGWAQREKLYNSYVELDFYYRWHYLQYDCEYCYAEKYFTKKSCEEDNKKRLSDR